MTKKDVNLLRGYVFCVFSAIPLALLWSFYGALAGDSTPSEWVAGAMAILLAAMFFTMFAGLLLGLPVVALLSRLGRASPTSVVAIGAASGCMICFAWLVAPAAMDPRVAESTTAIVYDTWPEMTGFTLSGAFAAAAFWLGMK